MVTLISRKVSLSPQQVCVAECLLQVKFFMYILSIYVAFHGFYYNSRLNCLIEFLSESGIRQQVSKVHDLQ